MEKALAQKTKVKVKKEPMDEDEPLGSSPEVILVSDEQEKEEKPAVKEYPPKGKDLKVTIETLTLRPVIPVDVNKHPQTARRGRGFCPDAPKPRWLGKTPTYNELEAAQTLVGLKQDQPKQGSIHNLRNKDIQEEKEEEDSDVTGVGERKLPSQGSCGSSVKEELETKDTDLTEETVPREVKVNRGAKCFLPVFVHQIVPDTFGWFLCSLLVFLFLCV